MSEVPLCPLALPQAVAHMVQASSETLPGRSQDGWKFMTLPWKGMGTLKKPEDSWLLLGLQTSTPPEPQEERKPFS